MPPLLSVEENGNSFPTVPEEEYEDHEDFSSLKRSLSRISNGLQSSLAEEPARRVPRPAKSNNHLRIDIPQLPLAAEMALAALQYLPTPLLVLSSLKTVLLANEAMGRLLGLQLDGSAGEEGEKQTVTDSLKGQTLSQIGVDLLQDGQPVWVSWEKFLDNLAADLDHGRSHKEKEDKSAVPTIHSGDTTPTAAADHPDPTVPTPTRKSKSPGGTQTFVHDTAVDVVVSAQHSTHHGAHTNGHHHKPRSPTHQVPATMIISIWKLEDQRYFTLSFTKAAPVSSHASKSQSHTHLVSRPSTNSTSATSNSSSSPTTVTPQSSSSTTSSRSSAVTSPSESTASIAPFPPPGAPSKCQTDVGQMTDFQKVTTLKDAILNVMKIPVLAMMADQSLTFPNAAARRLLEVHADATSDDGYDFLSRFKAYTPDFERQLEPDEIPIFKLIRTQKSFSGWKIGMIGPRTGKHLIFDVMGEAIFDEKSGEFLAGLVAMKDVTEYTEQLAAQNEENEQQFQLICDTMPQMLFTTKADGYHDYFSQRWYDYTGLTPKESMGMGWKLPLHPDDMTEAAKRWQHSVATGAEYSTEYRCKSKEGEWRWMLGRALPLRDQKTGKILKWFGSLTDIHEAVEARQEGKRIREQLLGVLQHAEISLWSLDRKKTLTFFEGHSMYSGAKEAAGAIGKPIYEVFENFADAKYMAGYKEAVERILNGESRNEVLEHSIKRGRWYRSRLLPILGKKMHGGAIDEHYVDGVIGISMDVTEVKSREQENVRLLANEAAAKEASRLKSSFLANMSHEIRTPIAGIIGMSELMMDTTLDEEQNEFAQNIQRSANGLLTVINDILDFSKVESGRLDIEEVQFSLTVVIHDVSKMLSFAAERKNLTFESDIHLGQTGDVVLLGDPGRVRQILTNLLTNSIKFTSEGYVKLSAAITKENPEVVWVTFQVEDTGIGIEEEVKRRLFKPFSQADSSTARRFGGTGLGLTICKNLVDLMHGTIDLTSTLGNGTKAVFSIPFNKPQFRGTGSPLIDTSALPDRLQSELSLSCNTSSHRGRSISTPIGSPRDTPEPTIADTTPNQLPHSLPSSLSTLANLSEVERQKFHILVVEDNAINQQIALKTIKNLKFSVNAVWNGKEALDYLLEEPSADHPWPDIILMDVQMPILDGYRATHILRHHSPYRTISRIQSIPIVAMTASAIQGDREKCEKAGMDDYLAKPVKRTMLEKMLVKWLGAGKRVVKPRPELARFSSEHDSECPASSVNGEASPLTYTCLPDRSNQSLTPTHEQKANLITAGAVPGLENEGDLGLRRVEAEEKASTLRDDKLMAASSASGIGVSDTLQRPQMPPMQLSEANVMKLNESHNEDATHTHEPSTPTDRHHSPSPVSMDSPSAVSDVGSLKAIRRERMQIGRKSSDWSESTAKP